MTTATRPVWRNRIVGAGDVAPAELVPNPDNWRTHPRRQVAALRGSLEEVGWVQQVLVNQRTGRMVDGHARVEQALERNEATVPVLYVDLSDEEERLVLATLDPIGALAGRDDLALEALLDDVATGDDGLRALLAELGASIERTAGLTDPDDAPPLPLETYVKPMSLWELGDHRLVVGDARRPEVVELVARGDVADLVWTDPPYGVAYHGGTAEALTIANDDLGEVGTRELVAGALAALPIRPGAVFYVASPGGPLHLQFLLAIGDARLRVSETLVWVKDRFVLGRSDFHYRHENLIVGDAPTEPLEHDVLVYGWRPGRPHLFAGGRRLDTVWEIPRPAASREHPTMKPVDLVARAMEYSSRAGDVVFDPFVGSGTTMIAAEQLGRRARAIELDPRYAQVAIERWQAFTGREATRVA